MAKQEQIVFIHGGDSFATDEAFYEHLRQQQYDPHPEPYKRWRDWLQNELETAGYEWLFMAMPNKMNADYEAWKIWFEKVAPYIDETSGTQVVGYSLGACFMLRYLSENEAPFTINTLHLVAPALAEDDVDGGLGSFAADSTKLSNIATKVHAVHVWHSQDDPICPYVDSEQVVSAVAGAQLHSFADRNHFLQPEFPELLAVIKNDPTT